MRRIPGPVLTIADLDTLGDTLTERVGEAVRGGLTWICLRAKVAVTQERIRLGSLIASLQGVFLTVHGDLLACRELQAPGLHLPSQGFDLLRVRREHPDVLLGVSCHSRGELQVAARSGVDYALLSPLFAPTSKPLRGAILGVDGFRRSRVGIDIPVLALGGMTPDRLAEAARAGADGVAVLGALYLAPDVEGRAREFRRGAEWVFTPGNG